MQRKFIVFAWAVLSVFNAVATTEAATKTWNAGVNTTWDTGATANWTGSTWTADDDAIFGATGVGTVTVTGAGVTANTITFNTAGYTISGGAITLTSGSDPEILANQNATINSNITLSGAQTWSASSSKTLTLGGTVNGSASGTNFGIGGNGNYIFNGSIGSNVALVTFNGAAGVTTTATFNAANTFTGSLHIGQFGASATVNFSDVNQLGSPSATSQFIAIQNGSTLRYTGAGSQTAASRDLFWNVGAATIDITQSTANLTFGITGGTRDQALTKVGLGQLTLSGGGATGPINLTAGTLKLLNAPTTSYTSATAVAAGATLEFSNTVAGFASRKNSGASLGGQGNLNITGGGWSGVIGIVSLAGQINVSGNSVFTNDNLTANWNGNAAALDIALGSEFHSRGQNSTFGALTGAGILANDNTSATSVVTLGVKGGSGTFTGEIHGNNTNGADGNIDHGVLALTKVGAGTQTLSGVGTYTGATTVNQGVLKLDLSTNTAGVLASASAPTMGGGTLQVQGKSTGASSQTLGNLTLAANTSSTITVSPNGGAGTTLTLGSTWTRNTGASVYFDLSAGTPSTAIVTSSPTVANGIIGGWATVTDNTATGFATVSGGNIARYTGASALATGSDNTNTNFTTSGNLTMSAITHNVYTLAVDTTGGGTLDLSGQTLAVNAAGGLLVNGTGNYTIQNGVISGSGATLAKFGTGTLTLNGANSYTGATSVFAGTLKAGAATSAFGSSSAVSVNNSATLDLNSLNQTVGSLAGSSATATVTSSGAATLTTGGNNTSTEFDGVLGGAVSVTKNGSGTFTLGGTSANTTTGAITVNAGNLVVAKTAGVTAIPANLTMDNVSSPTLWFLTNNQLSASSVLNFTGASGNARFDLFGTSQTLAGITTTSNSLGVIQNSEAILGAPSTTGYGTLTLNGSGTYTYSGFLRNSTGNLAVVKNGSGTQTLTVNSNQSDRMKIGSTANDIGSFTMSGGTLNVSNTFIVFGESGGTAAIFTQTAGTVNHTTGSGGTWISNGTGAVSQLTITGGAFNENASFQVGAAAGGMGTLTIGGGAGSATATTPTVTFGANSASSAGVLNLEANGLLNVGTISKSTGSGTFNFNGGTLQASADNASFMTGLTAANVKDGGAIIDTNGKLITIGQSLLHFAGATTDGLTKNGTGTLTLTGANTYIGGTTIKAGTLSAGTNAGALSTSGTITIGDTTGSATATLDFSGTGFTATNISGITVASGSSGTKFITTTGANAFVDNAPITLNDNVTISPAGTLTLGGAIGGSGFGITKSGAGTLTVSGANTYNGATTVNAGTLKAGVASVANVSGAFGNNSAVTLANTAGAALDITGFNTQIGSLTGGGATGGNVTLGAATLTIGGNNNSPAAYAGAISGAGGSVTKIGTGTLTLSGTNTFTANANAQAGTLTLSGSFTTNTVNVGGGGVASTVNYTGATATANNYFLGLNVNDTPTLNFSGNNTAVAQFVVGTVASANTATFNMTGGTLNMTNSGVFFILGNAAVPTQMTMSGGAMTTVSGVFFGNATGSTATVDINGGSFSTTGTISLGTRGSSTLNIANSGTSVSASGILFNQVGNAGEISTVNLNGGSLKIGSGGISRSTQTANFNFNGGTLQATAATTSFMTGLTTATVKSGGAFIDSNGNAITIDQALLAGAPSGGLTKLGANTLTLSGANTYTGATIISAGTLEGKGAVGRLPVASAVSIAPTATLQIHNDAAGTIAQSNNITISSAGTVTIDVGNAGGATTGSTVAFGALNNGTTADAQASTINFTGLNSYLQSYSSLALSGLTGQGTTLNPTTTSVIITGNVTNQESGSVTGHFDTLTLDGTSTGNAINGIISDAPGFVSVGNGDTRVTKSGTSTWTLSGASTYRGPTTISGGTLAATTIANSGTNSALGNSGNITISGNATLDYTGAGAANTDRITSVNSGTINVNAGALNISSGIAGGTLTKTGAATLTLSGATDNGGLGLTVSNGTVVLAKASTSAIHAIGGSNLTVNSGGTLQLGGSGGDQIFDTAGARTIASGGTLDMNGQNESFGTQLLSVTGTGVGANGAIINSSGTAATLTGTFTNNGFTVGGTGDLVVNGSVNGANTLTKIGGGKLTLGGSADNASLALTVNNGTVLLAKASTSAIHAIGGGNLLVNSGGTLQLGGSGGDQIFDTAGARTIASGGTLDMNGQNESFGTQPLSVTGTGVGANGAIVNSAAGAATLTATISNNDFTVGGVGDIDISGAVTSGSAKTLTKIASNTLTLSGTTDNAFLVLTVNNGTVMLGKTSSSTVHAEGGGAITIGSGATVKLAGSGGDQIANGAVGHVVNSGGTFDLGGQSETISGMTIAGTGVGGNGALINSVASASTLTGTITNGDFTVGGLGDIDITGAVSSASTKTLTKIAGNTLTLSGNTDNLFLALTVNNGTVVLNKASSGAVHAVGRPLLISGGAVQLGGTGGDQILDNAAAAVTVSGGTFDVNTRNETVGGLTLTSGSITGTTGVLTNLATYDMQSGTASAILAGSVGLSKTTSGTVTLGGTSANTFSGQTAVSAGVLELNKTAGVNALAGDGNAATVDDVVISGGTLRWLANDQVADTVNISQSSGAFSLNGKTETLNNYTKTGGTFRTGVAGHLTGLGATITYSGAGSNIIDADGLVQDAHLVLQNGATVDVYSPADSGSGTVGGILQLDASGTGLELKGAAGNTINLYTATTSAQAGKLILKGDVTTAGTGLNTIASITGAGAATAAGTVDLNAGTPNFTVADTAVGTDLRVSASIINGGLTKAGLGTMELSGPAANTYAGTTTVSGGTLLLNKSAGVDAIAGSTSIGAAGTLQLAAANQINNTASVTINSTGNFNLAGNSETINGLTGTGLGTSPSSPGAVALGGATLTVGGPFNVESAASAGTFLVTGGGTLNLNGTSTFDLYSASSYDFVSRTGVTVNANGTIKVNLATGFDPLDGDTFKLFQNGAVGGAPTFDFTGAARAGLVWDVSGFATDGTLMAQGVDGSIWDANNTGTGATNGTTAPGNWSDAKWTTSAAGTDVTGNFSEGTLPIFSAGTNATGTFTVVVDGGAHNVAGIQVEEGSVTLSSGGGSLNLTSAAIDVAPGSSLTVGAQLTGGVGLTKLGTGTTLTLSNTGNSYTGNTLVSAGTLRLGLGNVLPDGTNVSVNTAGTLNMNGFNDTVTSLTVDGGGSVSGTGTLTLTSNTTALTLSNGANLVNPNLQIDLTGGTGGVAVTGTAASGSQITAGIEFGAVTRTFTVADITASAAVDLDVAGTLSGSGAAGLIKAGAGTMKLSIAASYPGSTTVNDGVLQLGASNVLPNTTVNVNGPGQLDRNSFSDTIGALNLGGGQVLGSGTLTLGGTLTSTGTSSIAGGNLNLGGGAPRDVSVTSGTLTVSDAISNGDLQKSGAGILVLQSAANANTYGATTVAGGILRLGASNQLPGNLTVNVSGANGFDRNTFSDTIGTLDLNGGQVFGSGTLTLGGTLTSTGTSTVTGGNLDLGGNRTIAVTGTLTVNDVVQGAGNNLTKTGTGTLVLTNANIYSGTTEVNGGTLELSNTAPGGTLANTTLVTVGTAGGGAATDTLVLNNTAAHTLGTGQLLVGDTETGVVNHNAGNVTVGNGNADHVRIGVGAQGTYNLNNGAASTLNVGPNSAGNRANLIVGESNVGFFNLGANATVNAGDVIVGQNATGTGTITMTGGTLNVHNATTMIVGDAGTGTHTQSAGTVNAGSLVLGNQSTGNGTVNLSGTGSMNVTLNTTVGNAGTGDFNISGTAQHNVSGNLIVAAAAGSTGTYDQNLGGAPSTSITGNVNVGTGGAGTVNLANGTFTSSGNTTIGGGASAAFNQTGGTHTLNGTGTSGNMTLIGGGTYSLSGTGQLDFQDYVGTVGGGPAWVADNYSTLTMDDGADFTFSGGTLLDVSHIVTGGTTFTQGGGRLVVGQDESASITPQSAAALTEFDNNFTQLAGIIDLDVFGEDLTPEDCCDAGQNDALLVQGTATLGGVARLSFVDFDPAFGDIFNLVCADNIVLQPGFGIQGGFFRVVPTGNADHPFALQAIVPEPASVAVWTLVGLAGAAGAWRSRKRLTRRRAA